MSTKDLAKSITETSQRASTSFDRRHTNRVDRHATKQAINDFVNHASDDPDDFWIEGASAHYSWATFRLGPMYKFLRSKVGQKWSEVYSEIKKKFSDDSYSSRRLIHDQMLPRVVDSPSGRDSQGRIVNPEMGEINSKFSQKNNRRFPNFFVDGDGLLQDVTAFVNYDKVTLEDKKEIAKFLDNRVIAKLGDQFHWCFPKNGFWKIEVINKRDSRNYYSYTFNQYEDIALLKEEEGEYIEKVPVDRVEETKGGWSSYSYNLEDRTRTGIHWAEKEVAEGFVPRAALNEKELEQFNKFNSKCQELILSFGRGISN